VNNNTSRNAFETSSTLNKERWERCKKQSNSYVKMKVSFKTKYKDAARNWNGLKSDLKVLKMLNLSIRKSMSV